MNKTTVTFLVAAVVSLSTGVAAQADRFASVVIEATVVAPEVYMVGGAGGNIGVSMGRDGISSRSTTSVFAFWCAFESGSGVDCRLVSCVPGGQS